MSGQVKKTSGNILTARQIIDKILEIKQLEQNDLALSSGIIPNSLSKAIARNKLGGEIVMKISVKHGITKAFLKEGKEPILDPNHTSGIKNEQADILEHPLVKSFKDQINLLEQLLKMKDEEISRLKGLSGK